MTSQTLVQADSTTNARRRLAREKYCEITQLNTDCRGVILAVGRRRVNGTSTDVGYQGKDYD